MQPIVAVPRFPTFPWIVLTIAQGLRANLNRNLASKHASPTPDMSPTANDIELSSPPDDSISALAFAPNADDQLLVASWDGELRLYDVASNSLKSHFSHKAAVLGCCWGNDNKHAFSGGLDSWVRAFNTFASAGSDGTVSLWDHTAKKRLKQYQKYSSAVTAIAFTNTTGDKLAIGVSYAWDEGEDGLKREVSANGGRVIQVRVRTVGDECKPRGAK
ncbi:hypothetical protein FRC01_008869 [Tulasnella sp. 417]|nr:hypothetical protein FRC01_008869 [Tulasnella sp. 417]